MTAVWITIAALIAGTALAKASGALMAGGREPGERTLAVTRLIAPALLAALVAYETLSADGEGIRIDARLVGLAAAALSIAARLPMIVTVVAAAAATALARAV